MRIVLIGRGRVATNLLPALQKAGHQVTSVDSRTLDQLPAEADVFVVSVKDEALTEVVDRATKGREQQLFVHTAGSMPMSLFRGRTTRYGVLYPMQTFSKERLVDFSQISVFIEAAEETGTAGQTTDGEPVRTKGEPMRTTGGEQVRTTLRRLAESLTPHVYELSSDDRKTLHLAAVFACNFVNHCYALSADILARKGLPFSVMLPLVDETARKVHQLSPRDAQTGPAVRRDENVMRMQADMLSHQPQLRELYERLSLSIQEAAAAK